MTNNTQPPQPVIERYDLDPESIRRITGGLINRSFGARSRDGREYVLQQVNAVFPPEISDDIDAVTRHLHKKRLTTPLIVRTATGDCAISVGDIVWRLLTRVEGETHETVQSDTEASEAGRVLGDFHQALDDFDQPLICQRPGVHDTERHSNALRLALGNHELHAAHGAVTSLAEGIFELAAKLEPLQKTANRLVHGDPKISNVIFSQNRAICLIDLDTIAQMPVALELGDALRSWCNPAGEDSSEARFSIKRFHAALEGYRLSAGQLLSEPEWQDVPNATLAIAVELAARFAADALNESYFAWDRKRFASASRHNLARSAAQLRLATNIKEQLPRMHETIVTLT